MGTDPYIELRPHLREQSRQRRARNRRESAATLTAHGVTYTVRNDGAHLVVTHAGTVVDFWPGTGLYQPRGSDTRGRGVFNLLRALGVPVQSIANAHKEGRHEQQESQRD